MGEKTGILKGKILEFYGRAWGVCFVGPVRRWFFERVGGRRERVADFIVGQYGFIRTPLNTKSDGSSYEWGDLL